MSSRKTIIVFSDGLGNSGVHRVTSELTDAWARQGHKVIHVYLDTYKKNDENDYNWNENIRQIRIPTRKNDICRYTKAVTAFTRILRKNKNAVAVSLSVMTNFVLGACSLFVRNTIVLSDRNDPSKRPGTDFQKKIRDFAFKRADTIILQTDDVKDYYIKRIGKEGTVIPNPVNGDMPEAYEGPRQKKIVTASRLNKQKNLPLLINAFARLSKEYPDHQLEIYGRGSEEQYLQELITSTGMDEKISLMGFCDDIFTQIKDKAMYICSSDYEGISNALLEAMALGMPVISTDCPVGGSRLLIENGVNGILINVGDEDALYNGMKYLIDNPEEAYKMGINAQKVREKYHIDRIAREWIEAFDD